MYDVPGTSRHDLPAVQDFLDNFIRTVQPFPLFLYSNPTCADNERPAMERLRQNLGSDALQAQEILFVSNFLDTQSLLVDGSAGDLIYADDPEAGAELQKRLVHEVKHRYQLLREAVPDLPACADPLKDSPSFACIGTRDYCDREDLPESQRVVTEQLMEIFRLKLVKFCSRINGQRLLLAFNMLLRAVNQFMYLNSSKGHDFAKAAREFSAAKGMLEALREKLGQALVFAIGGTVPQLIHARAADPELREEAKKYAREKVTFFENAAPEMKRPEAIGACKDKMQDWIKREVIQHVMSFFQENLLKKLFEDFQGDLKNALKNELVLDAVMNEMNTFRIDESYFQFLTRKVGFSVLAGVMGVVRDPLCCDFSLTKHLLIDLCPLHGDVVLCAA